MNHNNSKQTLATCHPFFKSPDPTELRRFLFCLLLTFIWGLIAHAYVFFQDSFSHDSLNALYSNNIESIWKIQLGRILVPIYRALTRGAFTLPWLVGCLALLWIGISAYFVIRIFSIRSKPLIALIVGILATNLTVSSNAASYIHDFDVDMFALLMSTVAAYLWKQNTWQYLLLGTIALTASLCLYQSYVSVTIALIMIVSIFALLNKKALQR